MENNFFTTMDEAREFIKKDGMNLQYITNWLSLLPYSESEEDAKRNYIELALLAVTSVCKINFNELDEYDVLNHHPLEYIDSSISNSDYEKIAMAAVSHNGKSLKFVKRFRSNFSQNDNSPIKDSILKQFNLDDNNELGVYKQIVLAAAIETVLDDPYEFDKVPDNLKNDNDFILSILNINLENQDASRLLWLLSFIKEELSNQLKSMEFEFNKLKSFEDKLNYNYEELVYKNNDEQTILLDKMNQKKNLLISLEKKLNVLNNICKIKYMTIDQLSNLILDTSLFVPKNEYKNYTSFNIRIESYYAVDGWIYFLTDDINKHDVMDLLNKKIRCFIVSDTFEDIIQFVTEHLSIKKSKKISRKIKRKVPSEKKDNLLMMALKSLVNFYVEPIEQENISIIDAKKTK